MKSSAYLIIEAGQQSHISDSGADFVKRNTHTHAIVAGMFVHSFLLYSHCIGGRLMHNTQMLFSKRMYI